jgi:ankyrin repeat protein
MSALTSKQFPQRSTQWVPGAIIVFTFMFGIFAYEYYQNPPWPKADNALFSAVNAGDVDAALDALLSGADVHRLDMIGSTFLHTAAWQGNLPMARLLLEFGADINHADSRSGETPLHAAARGNRPEMAAFLIESGARTDSRTFADNPQCDGRTYPPGITPLEVALIADFSETARQIRSK